MKKSTYLKALTNNFFDKISFKLFNLVIFMYFLDIMHKQSINELLILGISLLSIIGSLAALSYTGSQYIEGKFDKHAFKLAGHRFFHSFISIIFLVIFSAVILLITTDEISFLKNEILKIIVLIPIIIVDFLYLYRSARGFIFGFHTLRKILDRKYPIKDEYIIDSIRKSMKNEMKKSKKD